MADSILPPLTAERLRERLHYDPETGVFTWREIYHTSRIGKPAGSLNAKGYVQIEVDGRNYRAHRLAWLYMTGEWPRGIDHRNRDRADNRWSNLRRATEGQNKANRVLPRRRHAHLPRGVFLMKGRYLVSRIRSNGRYIYLGTFGSVEEARTAYLAAARELHGEFLPDE